MRRELNNTNMLPLLMELYITRTIREIDRHLFTVPKENSSKFKFNISVLHHFAQTHNLDVLQTDQFKRLPINKLLVWNMSNKHLFFNK